tara:strand:+ start:17934 stop:18248 length:315 start_codon:yes stop_codon:yes gene_type:complete
MKFIHPEQAKLKMNKENFFILDIREQYEYDICKIEALHIPMSEILSRIDEISRENDVVVMCKSGNRAIAVANLLITDYEYSNVYVLEGGILAWIEQIEPNLEKY